MSSISSVGGGASAWSTAASAVRPARPPSGADPGKMFKQVDSDSSGGVNVDELQSLFTDMASKLGQQGSTPDAQEMLAQFDADGDGSLNQDELGKGLQSLMPPPSTMDFARQSQSAQGDGGPGGAGGPPPGGPPPADAASSSSSTGYDPLDTDEDGTVSAQEAAAGAATQALMQTLLKAVDTDDDGALSPGEMDTFQQVLTDQLQTAKGGTSGASGNTSTSSAQPSVSQLASLVIKQYAAMADSAAQQSAGSTLSLAA